MKNKNPWISGRTERQSARLRLFCFPYAGGAASVFRNWQAEMPPAIEVCPVQLPGRASRHFDPPFTHLPPLVEAITTGILPYLDKPFVLFGHSLGAILSFELARSLRKLGLVPELIIVSASNAAHIPDENPPIHDLPEPEFVERLRKLNGTPADALAEPELMKLYTPLLRADLAVAETYIYKHEHPLTCPISAFGGADDPEVDFVNLVYWQQHTMANFSIRVFSGDHFFIHSSRKQLIMAISDELSNYIPRV